MKWLLAAVGKAGRGPEQALFERYATRLGTPLTVREVEEKRPLPTPARQDREAKLLLDCLPKGHGWVVALDETGTDLSSVSLAETIRHKRADGITWGAFLIGGADGHGPAVRQRADLMLSFGKSTWPHQLVRVMLAEQLYRAQTILDGHPYHRA